MIDHRRLRCLLVCLPLLTLLPDSLSAGVYAPRVVAAGQPDPYSAATFLAHPRWKALPAEQRAEALGTFLFDPRHGLQVTAETPFTGTDPLPEHRLVRDPLQLWNVDGAASPETLCSALAALWDTTGPGRGRTLFDPQSQRWAAEIPTGTGSRRFFPAGIEFENASALQIRDSQGVAQYTRDLHLRRGETFTQWFAPQGERWRLDPAWLKDKVQKTRLLQPPPGPKVVGDSALPVRRANGRFVYEPLLQGDPADFLDGVLTSRNVRIAESGMTLEEAGEGFAVFAVETPFVIVPELGDIAEPKDDRGASVVEIDGAGLSAAWSPDAGATWISLETKKFPAELDLTKEVSGKAGYLLRLGLKGKPGEAVLKSLRVTTWVQLAPHAMPALLAGDNSFELKTRDHYGLETLPLVIEASGPDENEFLKYAIRPPREFNPEDGRRRALGPLSLRVPARPGTQIAWFTVSAGITVEPGSASAGAAVLGYATDRPSGFARLDPPLPSGDHNHWSCEILQEVRLEQPADAVFLQLEGRPALNAYRIVAHCVPRQARPVSPLRVTHRWREADADKESVHEVAEGARYQITAGQHVENVSVEYHVPGGPAAR